MRKNDCGCENAIGLPCVLFKTQRVVWICAAHWREHPQYRRVTDRAGVVSR